MPPSAALAVLAATAMAPVLPVAPAATPEVQVSVLERQNSRFAPVEITANVDRLPPNERRALALMLQAAQVTDALFLRQIWAGNEPMLLQLLSEPDSALRRARLHAFLLGKGPWSPLDQGPKGPVAFIPGVPPKPPAANFYPAGATKAEVEKWIASLPAAQRAKAAGFFTTIRRGPEGKLVAVPYSIEYQGELARMAELLREAASLTSQPTLKAFLEKRAAAFLSNDYHDSDVAWMKLDASIEPTVGPYEVYEDEWFNYKAAFEAFIALRDDAETAKLTRFGSELQDIENHLPIEPRYRNPKLGAMAPIRVVNSIFSAGDGNRGVQTAGYDLPNDERITAELGTKRVMLKNIQEAKFQKVLVPISGVALSKLDQDRVDFDAFFTHTLMHELMHGLGPHNIAVGRQRTTARQSLQEAYGTIEEAKADIAGLFAMQYLVDKGVLDKKYEDTMYVTFLASAFRAIRFGLGEAHGRGTAIQLNWILDHGGFRADPDGTFSVDPAKIKEAVKGLTTEFLTLEAQGDRKKAQEMIGTLAVIRPQVKTVLDRLSTVPVDIEPRYVTAEKLMDEAAASTAP